MRRLYEQKMLEVPVGTGVLTVPVYKTLPNADISCLDNGFHAFPDKEAFRVLKPGGIFCGCFYIQGENKRIDWFIEKLYTPKGFFTPSFETVHSLYKRLSKQYDEISASENIPRCCSA